MRRLLHNRISVDEASGKNSLGGRNVRLKKQWEEIRKKREVNRAAKLHQELSDESDYYPSSLENDEGAMRDEEWNDESKSEEDNVGNKSEDLNDVLSCQKTAWTECKGQWRVQTKSTYLQTRFEKPVEGWKACFETNQKSLNGWKFLKEVIEFIFKANHVNHLSWGSSPPALKAIRCTDWWVQFPIIVRNVSV